MDQIDFGRLLTTASYAVLGAIGGALGYILRSYDRSEKVDRRRLLVEACASAFVGYIVYQLCLYLKIPVPLTGPAVGLFGWLGAAASMGLLRRIIASKLGVEPSDDRPGDQP